MTRPSFCPSVFLSVRRSEITMKGGAWRSDFFSRKTTLNAGLHKAMLLRNPPSISASSKSEEETLLFVLLLLDAKERPFLTALALETSPDRLRYTLRAGTYIWRLRSIQNPINPCRTSPIPPLPHNNFQDACCTLYSIPSLHTV